MELGELKSQLFAARTKHSVSVRRASKAVKGWLILGGAFVAGVAQFWTGQLSTLGWSQIVGIVATIVVGLGGSYVLLTEDDAAAAIETASRAIDRAEATQAAVMDFAEVFAEFDRATETYRMCLDLRGALEQAAVAAAGSCDGLVVSLFELVQRQAHIAIGFAPADRWTIGVYKAEDDPNAPGKKLLRCIVHDRAIKCGIADARDWPEGVGIAGIAYTGRREIIIPDLKAEGVQAVFGPTDRVRPYDQDRYVSMVAVPINVAGRTEPWGVVNATSDREGHFTTEAQTGFKTDEPVRALAAFIALAVASRDALDRAHTGANAPAPRTLVRPYSTRAR